MLVTSAQMKEIETAAFDRGVEAEDLMERAGLAIAREIARFFPQPSEFLAVCGKGNNAGDVLVAARHLREQGWHGREVLTFPGDNLSPLATAQLARFRDCPPSPEPLIPGRLVIMDGLLGIGAQGAPRDPIAGAIRRINELRISERAFVVAADIPSGLDSDTGVAADPCVVADLTVTIGQAKSGLLADTAVNNVGRLALATLPELIAENGDPAEVITPELLQSITCPPAFDSHKGIWGRVGIIAGSRGFLGAGRLCSTAALHSGGGLVTLYALPDTYELLTTTCPAEVMVKPVESLTDALHDRHDAIAVGPGLGSDHDDEVLRLFADCKCPAVFDADGLNVLGRNLNNWPTPRGPRLFTPHPGEMARIFPDSAKLSRREAAEQFADQRNQTVLLKGARTVIAHPGLPTAFNSTGNPGMGSGGMGDVLTGVAAALLARGFSTYHAALLGAWLCGRSAEIAISHENRSPDSLVAYDVIAQIGRAFSEISSGAFSAEAKTADPSS